MTNTRTYTATRAQLQTWFGAHDDFPLKAMLVTGYAYSEAHEHVEDILTEITSGSVTRLTLSSVTSVADAGVWIGDAADPTWTGVTFADANAVIIYSDTGAGDSTSPVHGCIEFEPQSVTAGDFTVSFPAVGLFRVSDTVPTGDGLPAGGTTGQALVKASDADGDAEWATIEGGSGRTVVLFATDFDASGGSFTDVPAIGIGDIPRAYAVDGTVLITEGGDLGVWTITASGPCTAGDPLVVGQTINTFGSQGLEAVLTSTDGVTVDGCKVQATTEGVDATAAASSDAARRAAVAEASDYGRAEYLTRTDPGPLLELCNDFGGPHDSAAYLTPPPADFTTGAYWEVAVTPLPLVGAVSPSDGDLVYSELSTQTHDGSGIWDNFELALQRTYDGAAGKWRSFLFLEWTEIGGSIEDYSLNTGTAVTTEGVSWYYEVPEGIESRMAVHLDFSNGDSVWECNIFRETHYGAPTDTFAGREWVKVYRTLGPAATSIDTGVTDDWGIGQGNGKVRLRDVTVRDVGPAGTVLADPTAALAAAAGEGVAFTDGAGNPWTPGADAGVWFPPSPGLDVSDATPAALGTADPGTSPDASRADHVHDLPTAAEVGAQPADGNLDEVASLTLVADKLVYADGTDSLATTDFTSFARTLVDDADAAAARGTLGAKPAAISRLTFASGSYTPLLIGSATTITAVNERMYMGNYLDLTVPVTVDRFAVYHESGTATTGTIRLALYYPGSVAGTIGALYADLGNTTVDATTGAGAFKYVSGSWSLPAGRLIAAVVVQGLTGTAPVFTALSNAFPVGYPTAAKDPNQQPIRASVSGSAPDPAAPTGTTNTVPIVYVRAA